MLLGFQMRRSGDARKRSDVVGGLGPPVGAAARPGADSETRLLVWLRRDQRERLSGGEAAHDV